MKITKHGELPRMLPGWWITRSVTCTVCHCEFVLEPRDAIKVTEAKNGALCDCPDCGSRCVVFYPRPLRPDVVPANEVPKSRWFGKKR
jgi:hypothetical protein